MALQKTKQYRITKFAPEVLKQALAVFSDGNSVETRRVYSEVITGDEGWDFDNDADFFSSYRAPKVWSALYAFVKSSNNDHRMRDDRTSVSVTLEDKSAVERVFDVFEAEAKKLDNT
jgi:hypothetical protein